MKQLSRRILLLLALPAMLAVGAQDALAQQEGVSYYYHEWDYDALQGKNRVFNYGAICNNYKVLDSSTSLSESGGIGESDVIINIVDGGISFPDLGGGGTGDWSWSNEGIDGTSPDR